MIPFKFALAIIACCFLSLGLMSAQVIPSLTPLTVQGNQIMRGTQRFIVKGAAYDFPVHDDDPNWTTALNTLITTLPNLNFIRLYDMDPSRGYTKFIAWAREHNVYYSIPLTPNGYTEPYRFCALARMGTTELGPNTCYPSCLLNYGQSLMSKFAAVPEVGAYVVANEVFQNASHIHAGPCLKAYIRDLKTWRNDCANMRRVPLMYTAQEVDYPTVSVEDNDRFYYDYLTCGDETQSIDLYGLNVFRWCGSGCSSDPVKCGMSIIHDKFATNSLLVPVILSEYGCAKYFTAGGMSQREWHQVAYYYSSAFWNVFSGGVAYAYGKGEVSDSDFSFFTGGDEQLRIPGTQKTCANGICNVDLLAGQMAAIATAADSAEAITIPTGTRPVCPTLQGVDLTLAPTRQGADGYVLVECPGGLSTGGGSSTGIGGGGLVTPSTGRNVIPPPTPIIPKPEDDAAFSTRSMSMGIIVSLLAVIGALVL